MTAEVAVTAPRVTVRWRRLLLPLTFITTIAPQWRRILLLTKSTKRPASSLPPKADILAFVRRRPAYAVSARPAGFS